jgi:lipoprotein
MMKHSLCSFMQRAFYLLPAAFLLCSCVDSSVDYDDIDMKMKFNIDGLKVKFGDTEKIKLADLLKPEGNIKTDGNEIYYLVEQGQTHFDFTLKKPSAEVDANQLNVGYNFGDDIWKEVMKRLDDRQKATLAQTGYEVPVNEQPNYIAFEEADEFDFDLSWENDIVRLKRIDLENATFNFKLKLQDGVAKNFAIYGFRNIKITLPSYIKSSSANFKDGVYTFADRKFSEGQHEIDLGQLTVDSVAFAQALTSHRVPREKFSIKGEMAMGVKTAFHVAGDKAPKANIALLVSINGKIKDVVSATSVTGVFNPTIAPKVDPIQVKSQVPEFLRGDDVALKVEQLTLRFDADMREIPATVTLKNGKLTAQAGTTQNEVRLAPEGVRLEKRKENVVYFYHGEQPYDNETAPAQAQKSEVKDFNRLIEQIPDVVNVYLGNDAVQLAQEETTLEFGKTYHTKAAYKLLVPFALTQGLKIDYTDETNDIDLDAKELTTDNLSITVQAEALTNIPLSMKAKLIPLDEKGAVIADISVTEVEIKGSSDGKVVTRPIMLTLHARNPKSLQLLKRFKFAVKASADEVAKAQALRSDQYLQIKNAKLHLGGGVIADFN